MNASYDNWFTASGWTLRESRFDVRRQGKCESVMHLSDGFIGIRAATEEDYPFQTRGTFVAGVFDGVRGEPRELANAADMLRLELEVCGQRFSLQQGETLSYGRTLDMRESELARDICWRTPDGHALRLSFRRFVSQANHGVYAQRVTITPLDADADVRLTTGIDARMSNTGTQHFIDGAKRVFDGRYLLLEQTTQERRYRVTHGCVCRLAGGDGHQSSFAMKRRLLEQTLRANVARGQTLVFEKLCLVTRGDARGAADDFQTGLDRLRALCEAGYDAAYNAHREAMREFWAQREIRVEASDPFVAGAIHYAQHALRSFLPVDRQSSIAAKGLSGEGYKGHVFWDVETFLLPYYLYHQPEKARQLLTYRVDRLNQAMNNARLRGHRGVMFPWESADIGYDETPLLGQIDIVTGKANPILSGLKEYHITADIALAAWQYWKATGDDAFMREGGTTLIVGAALFWTSLAEWNEQGNRYEIKDVIGPDEYTEGVDNNAYTNYTACKTLGYACILLDAMDADGIAEVERRFGERNLPELFRRVRDGLYLPRPNAEGIIPQNDGFLEGDSIDLTPYVSDHVRQSILKNYTRARVNQMQILKQADVVMLLALFPHLFDRDTQLANWRYYEPRTIHDSSLSRAIYSLTACRLGMRREAYDSFLYATRIDIGDNPVSSDDGIHAASLGGIWMDVVMGFCGLYLADDTPELYPALPDEIQKIETDFCWQGRKLRLTVSHESLILHADSDDPIELRIYGKPVTLRGTLVVPLGVDKLPAI